jgi:hypothetical protein
MDATQLDERTARAREQNAERVKRYRARKAAGGCVFTVDLSGDYINRLIKVGALSEAHKEDVACLTSASPNGSGRTRRVYRDIDSGARTAAVSSPSICPAMISID